MSNLDVTLKRYNGSENDVLFVTTHMGQIQVSAGDTTPLTTYLSSTYVPLSQKGVPSGVVPLDATAKIAEAYLPTSILGGLRFQGVLSTNTDLDFVAGGYDDAGDNGRFFIANAAITLTSGSGYSTVLAPGDEGDYNIANGIDLEIGDWIILTSWATNSYTWAIIDNDYAYATTTTAGYVRLTAATDRSGLTNGGTDVITEDFLYDNVLADSSDLASNTNLNKIAPAAHKHDGLYYTETEIGNWVLGTTTIQSQYFRPIVYGATPTSTIEGAILIDLD